MINFARKLSSTKKEDTKLRNSPILINCSL